MTYARRLGSELNIKLMILLKIKYLQNNNNLNSIKSVLITKKQKFDFRNRLKFKLLLLNRKYKVNLNVLLYNKNSYNFFQKDYNNAALLRKNKQIFYIFVLNFNYSNVFINIINSVNEQIISFSLGFTKFKSLDKITKKYTILQNLKDLISKTEKYTNIAIHFNSANYNYNKLILNFLKNYYYIQIIKFFNYLPHNGCRPRKKRRK